MLSKVKPCNRFEFSHISSPPATTATCFLHYSLVDQQYAKEVYFCSFVTKFNQVFTKYSPDVFKSFYRTVTYGGFHRIFTSPLVKWHFPTFHYRTSSFCCLPFFSLKNSKSPPKDIQYFNRFWQASSHSIFPLQTKFPFWSSIFPSYRNTPSKVHAV